MHGCRLLRAPLLLPPQQKLMQRRLPALARHALRCRRTCSASDLCLHCSTTDPSIVRLFVPDLLVVGPGSSAMSAVTVKGCVSFSGRAGHFLQCPFQTRDRLKVHVKESKRIVHSLSLSFSRDSSRSQDACCRRLPQVTNAAATFLRHISGREDICSSTGNASGALLTSTSLFAHSRAHTHRRA